MAQLHPIKPSGTTPVDTPALRPRVLVIDDHDGTREIITHILQKEFDVITLGDGAEGWERIQSDDAIVAVITDINLPNMTGIEIMQHARAHADERIKELPIIAITGAHDKDLQRRAYLGGVTGFIYKPIDMPQLKALMNAYVHANSAPKPKKEKEKEKAPVAAPATEAKAAEVKPAETKPEETGVAEAKTDDAPNVIDFTPASTPADATAAADASSAQLEASILESIGEPLMSLDETPTSTPEPAAAASPTGEAPAANPLETLSVEELEAMIKEVSVKPANGPTKPKKAPVVKSPGAAPARSSRVSIDDALSLLRDQPHK